MESERLISVAVSEEVLGRAMLRTGLRDARELVERALRIVVPVVAAEAPRAPTYAVATGETLAQLAAEVERMVADGLAPTGGVAMLPPARQGLGVAPAPLYAQPMFSAAKMRSMLA